MTVKCSMPARKILHSSMPHATARHSSSITAYLLSASVRNRDPACTVFHSLVPSVDFCRSINLIPKVLVSVRRRVSFVVSKYAKVGEVISTFLACVKASSWGLPHRNSLQVLSSGRRGANVSTMSLVLEVSWLTRPKKERRSARLLGFGNCAIASVMSVLTEYPSGVRVNPAKWAFCRQNWNFFQFRDIYFSLQQRNICWTCCTCFRGSLLKMMTSSTILRKSSRPANASSFWCSVH